MTAIIALAAAKSGRPISAHRRRLGVAAIVLAPAIMFFSHCALADESGVSFWIPGLFGSLAATPQQPGWSLANIYYHTSVSAGADVARAREFTLGRVPANVTVNANLNLNVNATGDLGFVLPSYVFATPVLGGQASVSLLAAYGVVGTSLAGTLSGVATGPFGNTVPFARSDTISDTTWGFGDLAPMFQLKWNAGVHNYMTYITGDIPVGAYQSTRLSNIGIGHGAIDAGGGYTYFNPQTGHEVSGVLGFTYNTQEYCDAISERRRPALRLGCIAIPVEAGHGWPRGLCLQGDRLRQRLRRPCRLLPVPGVRHRPPDRIPFSGRRHAGISQSEGLRRIRQCKSASGLEYLGHLLYLAARARSASDDKADRQKILGSTKLRLLAHSCPGRVRRHVRSWRKPTPHSKAHPLVNRLNLACRIAPLD